MIEMNASRYKARDITAKKPFLPRPSSMIILFTMLAFHSPRHPYKADLPGAENGVACLHNSCSGGGTTKRLIKNTE